MAGLECPLPGMPFPVAAAGFVIDVEEMDTQSCVGGAKPSCAKPKACRPDKACQQKPWWQPDGVTGATVKSASFYQVGDSSSEAGQVMTMVQPPPGCTRGYDDLYMCDKCCAAEDRHCAKEKGLKFYREAGACVPCPAGLTFMQMVLVFFMFVVGLLVFVSAGAEKMWGQTQMVNHLATPFIILVTFVRSHRDLFVTILRLS